MPQAVKDFADFVTQMPTFTEMPTFSIVIGIYLLTFVILVWLTGTDLLLAKRNFPAG
jgi:hypothetical protein